MKARIRIMAQRRIQEKDTPKFLYDIDGNLIHHMNINSGKWYTSRTTHGYGGRLYFYKKQKKCNHPRNITKIDIGFYNIFQYSNHRAIEYKMNHFVKMVRKGLSPKDIVGFYEL